MSQRLPARPITTGPHGRRCLVRGCATKPEPNTIICPLHAQALRRPEPPTDDAPTPEDAA
jgi:hypothetical protein